MKKYILLLSIFLIAPILVQAKVVYVNGSYTGSQDGKSWGTPYKTLDSAIIKAADGDEIWVARGEYKPKSLIFGYNIRNNISLYGGFKGNESTIYTRNLENDTTLINALCYYGTLNVKAGLNVNIDGFSFTDCNNGGAIAINDSIKYSAQDNLPETKIKIENCNFFKGRNPLNILFKSSIEVINSSFYSNENGAIFLGTSISPKAIHNIKFINSFFYNYKSTISNITYSNTDFIGCKFYNNTESALLGIYSCGKTNLQECKFYNNSSSYNFIDITGIFDAQKSSELRIKNCEIRNNLKINTNFWGLFLYVDNLLWQNNKGSNNWNSTDIFIENSSFIDNIDSSGTLLFSGSEYDQNKNNNYIKNCNFINNNRGKDRSILEIYKNGAENVTIEGCEFRNNIGRNVFITNSNALDLIDCKFDSCVSYQNGGALNYSTTSTGLNIINSSFTRNRSYLSGGAIYLSGDGNTQIDHCAFTKNFSNQSGGAIRTSLNGVSDNLLLSNSVFKSNFTKSNGGAASFQGNNKTVNNCVFDSNYVDITNANSYAGAIELYGGVSKVNNCIFSNNIASRHSAFIHYGYCYVNNSTICNNHVKGLMPNDFLLSATQINNCIITDNHTGSNSKIAYEGAWIKYTNIQGGYSGEGNTDLNPLFVDAPNGNFRLTCASPLINRGNNSDAPDGTDLDGKVRIFGGTVDMGAYEFPQDPATATAPPTVNFSISNSNACKSEVLTFGNTTSPFEGTQFEWNFGDGSKSNEPTPSHAYTQSGTFTVTLKATNACGANATLTKQITIKPSFAPSIAVATVVCPNGQSEFSTDAQCTGLTWSVLGGSITSGQGTKNIAVQWGDGSTGNGKVTLNVDNCGAGFCNVPVSIEIPIIPTIFEVQGNTKPCQDGLETYTVNLKDASPSTLYTWQAVGGTLSSSTSTGYDLTSMGITWASNVTVGKVILTTYNELLKCGGTDTLAVAVRPKFKVAGTDKVCTASQNTYTTNPTGAFLWSVAGSNTVGAGTGLVTWGVTAGKYFVVAQPTLAADYCNAKDSLQVEVIKVPVVQSITGAQEVDSLSTQTYLATVSSTDVQYNWQVTGGQNVGSSGNQILVSWTGNKPYKVGLTVTTKTGSCTSPLLELPVKTNFVYKISGKDTVCINSPQTYTSNTDTSFAGQVFTWSGGLGTANTNSYAVSFTEPGYQYLNLKVQRGLKETTAQKKVLVKAAYTGLSISGATEIAPTGGGTYSYTVSNPNAIAYTYIVKGASTSSQNGNIITVTWGNTEPFSITLNGTVPGNSCTGVPVILEVSKAPTLENKIISTANACLNASVTYSFPKDRYTSNLQWSISGGGTITATGDADIKVLWGSTTGNYTVTLKYDRFGAQTATLPVTINPLPNPVIADQTICGVTPTGLSTTSSYTAYAWTLEDDAFTSTLANPSVTKEGLYKVVVKDANGCEALTSKYIKQIPLPEVNIFTDQQYTYCQTANGTSNITLKTLEGNSYQYQWLLNGTPITGADTSSYNFVLSLATPIVQKYSIKTSVGICAQSVEKSFQVIPASQCGGGNPCTEPALSFTVNSTCQPYSFTNTSADLDQSSWSFGDGTSYLGANPPAKTFSTVGIFDVYLSRKCQYTSTKVEVPAVAIFKLESPGCNGKTLSFKDYSANIPGLKIESWTWNFGDGTGDFNKTDGGTGKDLRDISHTFNIAKSYVVSLTVRAKNSKGVLCTHTSTQTVKITASPAIDFTIQSAGCTSSVYSFTDNSTIATDGAKYLWTFQTGSTSTSRNTAFDYTVAGSKTVQLEVTDLWGCKSTLSKPLTVVTPLVKGKIAVSGELLLCNGKTVTLSSPSGFSYIWRRGNSQVATTATYIASAGGKYTVTYSNPTCSITTDTVEVIDYKVNAVIMGTNKVCTGNTIALNTGLSDSKYSFEWKFKNTPLANSGSGLYINDAQLKDAGSYTITVKDNNNACVVSLPSFKVDVFTNPSKPVVSSDNSNVCYASSFSLSTSANTTGYSLQWLKNSQNTTGTTNPYMISNVDESATANYQLQITDNVSACTAISDPIYIKVYPQLSVMVKGDALICEKYPFALNTELNNSDFDFDWMRNGTSLGYNNNKYSLSSIALTDTGKYTVKISSKGTTNYAGCATVSAPFSVAVKAGPAEPKITGPDEFCQNTEITLTSSVNTNIKWGTGETTQSIKVTLGGSYTVTATNTTTGCTLSSTKSVLQNPAPNFSFYPAGIYERCGSDKIAFAGLASYPYYQWYVDGVKFRSPNKDLYPTKSGAYTLEVKTDKGCVGLSDTMFITSLECPCYVTNTKDAGDGSLRDAINCSNSKEGKDIIKFAITENGGVGPFTITPLTALPTLTDSVSIDGFSQSGEDQYDIIIDGSTYAKNALTLDYTLANCRIAGLVFNKFSNAITLKPLVNNNLIEKNRFVLNTGNSIELSNNCNYNRVNLNTFETTGNAIALISESQNNTIEGNTITAAQIGVGVFNKSKANTIKGNQISNALENGLLIYTGSSLNLIKGNTIGTSKLNGISVESNSKRNTLDSNYIGTNAAGANLANTKSGINIAVGSDSNTVSRNTIAHNLEQGINAEANALVINNNDLSTANQKFGILSKGSNNLISYNVVSNHPEYGISVNSSSVVLRNTLKNNAKGGIYVTASNNKISKNTISNTSVSVKAIDLHFSALPAANAGKTPASFGTYRRSTTGGIVLKGTSVANDSVEVFYNNNLAQQALAYVGAAKTNAAGIWELEISSGNYFDPNARNYYVNTATTTINNTSELSNPFASGCFNCICLVENVNDLGQGSLRAAVDSAHTGKCLVVNFNITTPDTINLLTPLRDIKVPVTVNGVKGIADPAIAIKGQGTGIGFNILNEGVNVNNLSFANWYSGISLKNDYALIDHNNVVNTKFPVTITGNNNTLKGNCFNCNQTGTNTYISDTAVVIRGNNNILGQIGEGNKIINANSIGIKVDKGTGNQLLYNFLVDNPTAIKLINNGNKNHAAPTSLVGSLVGNSASISGKAQAGDRIQIFLSDLVSVQTANPFVIETIVDATGNWSTPIPNTWLIPNNNTYFVTTATHTDGTSELSEIVRVGNVPQICYVTNTLNLGKGSLRTAVDCANNAGKGSSGTNAHIVFQLSNTMNTIDLASGLTVTNNFGVLIDPTAQIPVTLTTSNATPTAFTWASSNLSLINLNFDKFSKTLVSSGNNANISNNQFNTYTTAVSFTAGSQTIASNYFANGSAALVLQNGTANINQNIFGAFKDGTDAAITDKAIQIRTSPSTTLQGNAFKNIANQAILATKSQNVTLVNNTFTGKVGGTLEAIKLGSTQSINVSNNTLNQYVTGILLDTVTNGNITLNTLKIISTTGLDLKNTKNIHISQNTVEGLSKTGKPINLHYSAASVSNNAKTFPKVESITYFRGKLMVYGKAEPYDHVEVFASSNGIDLKTYLKTLTADQFGKWTYEESMKVTEVADHYYRATAVEDAPTRNTSEASDSIHLKLKVCPVLNTADAGPNSLRGAITDANNSVCNYIMFEIGTGAATIAPTTTLPVISAPYIIIDGTSQPGYVNQPLITVSSTNQSFAFKSLNTPTFNIHGIHTLGYDTAIIVQNTAHHLVSLGTYENFNDIGILDISNASIDGSIDSNRFVATNAQTFIDTQVDDLLITNNTLQGNFGTAIKVQAEANKLQSNKIEYSGTGTGAIAISIANAKQSNVEFNEIKSVAFGIKTMQTQESYINNNTINDSLHLKMKLGISLEQSTRDTLFGNKIENAAIGLKAKGFANMNVAFHQFVKIDTGMLCLTGAQSTLSGNVIKKIQTGVILDQVNRSKLESNRIFDIATIGVLLKNTSTQDTLVQNLIGGEVASSMRYNEGLGIKIENASNHRIGLKDFGNTLFHNKKGGIIVNGGTGNSITYNSIFENDKTKARPTAYAIKLENNGNLAKVKPSFMGHKLNAAKDSLTLFGTSQAGDSIHLYNGKGGYEEARVWFGSGKADGTGKFAVQVNPKIKLKDLLATSTLYLTATGTDVANNTSPLSDMYIMGDCYVTSLADTNDNDYPLANSLRMAVKCANVQNENVGIFYSVDQFDEKNVKLQGTLMSLKNTHGVHYQGVNTITDQGTVGIDFDTKINTDTLAWYIDPLQGPSSFDHLKIINWKSGVKFDADSQRIVHFSANNMAKASIYFTENTQQSVVDSAMITNVNTAIRFLPGAQQIQVRASTFEGLSHALYTSDTSAAIGLSYNTFKNNKDYSIALQNAGGWVINNNTFESDASHSLKALQLGSCTKLNIFANQFVADTMASGNPMDVVTLQSSDSINVSFNQFTLPNKETAIRLYNTTSSIADSNSVWVKGGNAFSLQASERNQFAGNSILVNQKDAFELQSSDYNQISRNRVVGTSKNVKCIKLNYGSVQESNEGIPTPKFKPSPLSHSIKVVNKRRGLFVTGEAQSGDSVDVFFSDSTYASMNNYIGTAYADTNGAWELLIPRQYYKKDTVSWYHVVATATNANRSTSETDSVYHIPPQTAKFYVLNRFNDGPNTLRDALRQVDSCDLKAYVIFRIGGNTPYRIQLDSLLYPVNSVNGFIMDGKTQLACDSADYADKRIFVECAAIDTAYALVMTPLSDSSTIASMWFANAQKGLKIENNSNKLDDLHLITEDASVKGDTALWITGNKNKLTKSSILGYQQGILIDGKIEGTKVYLDTLDSVKVGLTLRNQAFKNTIDSCVFINTDSIGYFVDRTAGTANFLKSSTFGAQDKPVKGTAVWLDGARSQTVTKNRMAYLANTSDTTLATGILISDTASFNSIIKNTIGLDSASQSPFIGWNIQLNGFDEQLTTKNNFITANTLVGASEGAIKIHFSEASLISNNIIGDTSGKDQYQIGAFGVRIDSSNNETLENNSIVGFDSSGIEVKHGDYITMSRNIVYSSKSSAKGIDLNVDNADSSNVIGAKVIQSPVIENVILLDTSNMTLSGTTYYPSVTVDIYEGYKGKNQAFKYVNTVTSDANRVWTYQLKRTNFAFDKSNYYVAQLKRPEGRSSELSVSVVKEGLLCDLGQLSNWSLIDDYYHPCPGPAFNIAASLGAGLKYLWTKTPLDTANKQVLTDTASAISIKDSSYHLKLRVSDQFGCSVLDTALLDFKTLPFKPDFLVASEVFTDDTIVVIDVSKGRDNNKFEWSTTGGTVIPTSQDTIVGPDGKTYPKDRVVQLQFLEKGDYTITQRSTLEGCYYDLEKSITVEDKKGQKKGDEPVIPEMEELTVNPNPVRTLAKIHALVADKDPVDLQIVSSTGVVLENIRLSGKSEYKFELSVSVPAGVYTFRLMTHYKTLTQKVIILN